jgi:GAF domain-containing protein
MSREAELARTFVELADTLVDNFDVVDFVTRLADRCVKVLDAEAVAIMLAGTDGQLRVMGSSSDAMRVLEVFEIQAQEGPCVDCHRTGLPVVSADIAAESVRWPNFAPQASAAGFGSAHALPMRLRGLVIGALNLFRAGPGELEPGDVELAQAFADVATIGILQNRAAAEAQVINEQLTEALSSRVVIEQAKGIVSERLTLDVDEAFAVLRQYARNNNQRLADLARAVIDGTLSAQSLGSARRAE